MGLLAQSRSEKHMIIQGIASTCASCAQRRAQNLFVLGSRRVLELCVGPSLLVLRQAYSHFGIEVVGNDIDPKWKNSCLIGDALTVSLAGFDTAVFAPPLSKSFSGRREDSLRISQVLPAYSRFLNRKDLTAIIVLVLPGRSFSTRQDRKEFYALLSILKYRFNVDYDALLDERGRVVKYVDVYLTKPQCIDQTKT